MHTLHLDYSSYEEHAEDIAAAVAAGLASANRAAAAAGGATGAREPGLLLHCYQGPWSDSILKQLPAESLTALTLPSGRKHAEEMEDDYYSCGQDGRVIRMLSSSFRNFTNLQHLSVMEDEEQNVNALLPALEDLQQLTSLHMAVGRGTEEYFKYLPVTLRELHLGAASGVFGPDDEADNKGSWPGLMDLSHLTAVTKLDLNRNVPFEVLRGDVLPPNVQDLAVGEVASWEPILQLQDMRILHSRYDLAADLTLDEIQCLRARTPPLEHLSLQWVGLGPGGAAKLRAWAGLPLRGLDCRCSSAAAMEGLTGLTTLTSLDISSVRPEDDVRWEGITAAIKPLTQLVDLQVEGRHFHHNGDPLDDFFIRSTTASLPFVESVGRLPLLRSLGLQFLFFSPEAASALAAATDLTKLNLSNCGLDDYMVNALILHMPGLQHLQLCDNNAVTNAVMPVIAKLLPRLESLHLWHTQVNQLGLQWLTELQHLRDLGVCRRMQETAAAVVGQRRLMSTCCCPRLTV